MDRLRVIVLLAFAGGLVSCDRSSPTATVPTTGPAQVVAATTSPDTPATTQPARGPSVMMIDQQRYEFPAALLQLRRRDGHLDAILLSDDPKDAISENYHGNSYYLQIPAQANDVKDLLSAPWRYTAPSNERSDSPDGIFLDGNRLQLQPGDISVRIEGESPLMTVYLSGNFQLFDTHDDKVPSRLVPVMATLSVKVR